MQTFGATKVVVALFFWQWKKIHTWVRTDCEAWVDCGSRNSRIAPRRTAGCLLINEVQDYSLVTLFFFFFLLRQTSITARSHSLVEWVANNARLLISASGETSPFCHADWDFFLVCLLCNCIVGPFFGASTRFHRVSVDTEIGDSSQTILRVGMAKHQAWLQVKLNKLVKKIVMTRWRTRPTTNDITPNKGGCVW